MGKNQNIVVPGYAQKVIFDGGIEYRNFTPDLVGRQLTLGDNDGSSLFTFGNFVITTNTSPKEPFNSISTPFSNFYTLNDLTKNGDSNINSSNIGKIIHQEITLNTDNTNLCNFAYFGSATEFIRVSLESIITKWPASIYSNIFNSQNGELLTNVQNYYYDNITNTSSFKLLTNSFYNNFDVVYDESGLLIQTKNSLRNLTINYKDYNILYNGDEFKVINFTPSTNLLNDYVIIEVEGELFKNVTETNLSKRLHIKPNKIQVELFFSQLTSFENNLLNRLTTPLYTSSFKETSTTSTGVIYETTKTLTWPTTDGYNIDFNTNEYVSYVSELLNISNKKDNTKTNLIVRFLTAEAISNFDTIPRCDGSTEDDASGQKMNKTLKIYGRNFDEIKKYIDGISFTNRVTYDKKNNTPDQVLKYLARTIGWELTSSILGNDLIQSYLSTSENSYEGQNRGLTPYEAEIELWRRLILNSGWLWKSKGTRKAIEFLFKFIGTPKELVSLNEYLYVAKNKINVNNFLDLADSLGISTNFDDYYFDDEGFPKPKKDTSLMYFQKGGLWYRETGGPNALIKTSKGNNPHVGPYDGGVEYINNFRDLLPGVDNQIIENEITTREDIELFTNYNNGIVNGYSGDTFISIETIDGVSLDECFVYESEIIGNPYPENDTTECGCELPTEDLSIHIRVTKDDRTKDCDVNISGYTFTNAIDDKPKVYLWDYIVFNIEGTPISTNQSEFISPDCCKVLVNGEPFYHEEYKISEYTGDAILKNVGYVCCKPPVLNGIDYETKSLKYSDPGKEGCGCYITCKWRLAGTNLGDMVIIGDDIFLKFVTPKNNWGEFGEPEYKVVSESDSCFCPLEFTKPQLILDPYTNKMGYGCKLSPKFAASIGGENFTIEDTPLYQLFFQKSIGNLPCQATTVPPKCRLIPRFNRENPLTLLQDNPLGEFTIQVNDLLINGGSEPFSYEWEIIEQAGYFYNYLIDDNKVKNPILYKGEGPDRDKNRFDVLVIKVTVTDIFGCQGSDILELRSNQQER